MQEVINVVGLIGVFGWSGCIAVILLVLGSRVADKKNKPKPYLRWIIIFLLCVTQAGCLGMLAEIGTMGGGARADYEFTILFIIASTIWLLVEILSYRK